MEQERDPIISFPVSSLLFKVNTANRFIGSATFGNLRQPSAIFGKRENKKGWEGVKGDEKATRQGGNEAQRQSQKAKFKS